MPTVILPSSLLERSDGVERIELSGTTAGGVLKALEQRQPKLKGWMLDEHGRLRQHVNLFVNHQLADLDQPIGSEDEIHVIQAISGGSPEPALPNSDCELLIGTQKGLLILRGDRGQPLTPVHRAFAGQVVEYALRDPRTGYYFASVTHGQFGPHLYRSADPTGATAEWEQMEGPAFPNGEDDANDTEATLDRIWVVEPGETAGELWAGVAPAALFHSTDDGCTWELNRALWDHPTRPQWEGGFGGLCLHSICPWPEDPQRLAVGVSAAGVWLTEDGGASWERGVEGLVPRYLPEEARPDTLMHCIHKMVRCPLQPARIFMQYHGGVYRSDDAGNSWTDIANLEILDGLPADFGFPIVIDPRDPNRAFVIPLNADMDRVTVDGKLRVFETTDAGNSWQPRAAGLPQNDAYLTILRQAFCHDGSDPLGLYFGAKSGEVFGSVDAGASWHQVAHHLPAILSVRSASPPSSSSSSSSP